MGGYVGPETDGAYPGGLDIGSADGGPLIVGWIEVGARPGW
jgi:hypothetical protein